MAYAFVPASSQHISGTLASGFAFPLTLSALFRSTDIAAVRTVISIAETATNARFVAFADGASGGDPIQFATNINNPAFSTTGFSNGIWDMCAGIARGLTDKSAYINGGNRGNDTTANPTATLNTVGIGARFNSSFGVFFQGDIAEAAIWNVDLTDAEIASLGKGFKPLRIRPQSLRFYAPIVRNIQDLRGAITLTNNGSATVANHPRVY
jgi:hypothetical protein